VASYTVSLLNPKIIADLKLHDHGLKIVERKVNNFWVHEDGNFLAFPVGTENLKTEIALFSKKDADSLERYFRDTAMVADLIRDFLLETPPNAGGGLRDVFKAATKSVADFLALYFENDYVKGAFAFDGIVGNYADTHTPGSAYVLMHHAFGEVNGKKGVWGHAIGGMGAITQAMAQSAIEKGVIIETDKTVTKVIVENQRAVGVELENGDSLKAKTIASNLNPSLLFNSVVDAEHLPPDFSRRMKHYRNGSGTFRMNVALSELPQFTCLKSQTRASQGHLTGGIVIAPTMEYIDQSYRDAKIHGWSSAPIIEMLIPSTLDDTLAPKDQHVASLFCQLRTTDFKSLRS